MPKGVYPRTPGKPRPGARRRRAIICVRCGLVFQRPQSDTRRKYCGIACYSAHFRGANHPNYKGGTRALNGYRILTLPDKRVAEHRVIAERALGRPLKRDEVVHHINGDKTDNRNSNLLICTRAYHQWLHHEMGLRYAREKFGIAA